MSESRQETYLGDGLYASFDGFMITLRAPRGPEGDHWVALEPAVYTAFINYARSHGITDPPIRTVKP